ncbi:hypothetical protein NL676_021400 [Syzygium grande]|nr:hypothetical protein NL676_021400 [Syzygium grande]
MTAFNFLLCDCFDTKVASCEGDSTPRPKFWFLLECRVGRDDSGGGASADVADSAGAASDAFKRDTNEPFQETITPLPASSPIAPLMQDMSSVPILASEPAHTMQQGMEPLPSLMLNLLPLIIQPSYLDPCLFSHPILI